MSSVPQVVKADAEGARDWQLLVRQAWITIAIVFGLGGLWAAVARLDSGAVASGVVAVESSRKTIQHLEGGIIREILARDGDLVREGQLLVRLDETQARAMADVLRKQLAATLAEEARLVAERDEADDVVFPQEVMRERGDPAVERAIIDQHRQFRERRANLKGQVDVLEARLAQVTQEIAGTMREKQANEEQVATIAQELAGLRMLLAKNLVQVSRVLALEREQSRLGGAIGRADADKAKLEQAMGETRLQIAQLRQQFLEAVSKDLPATRKAIEEIREKLRAQEDVLRRVAITAPQTGVIQNMKVFTVGGVIRPGDAIMDIAPVTDELVIRAQVSPLDVDNLRIGDVAEVRFPSFTTRKPPLFFGKLKRLSRDRLVDDNSQTRQPYFAAEIAIDFDTIDPRFRDKILAGMSADVVITTGERTALQYLISPLLERLGMGMREH
jgi:HlyD family type I secretion membrane fusion protein